MTEQVALDQLLAEEDKEKLPFVFSSAKENPQVGTREAGSESEYWTAQYNIPDTD